MATIAENLQKIINSKAAIKTSIINKGGSITDSTPLDEYAPAIDNLPSGGGGGEYIVKEPDAADLPNGYFTGLGALAEEISIPSKYTVLGYTYPSAYTIPNALSSPNNRLNIAGWGAPSIKKVTVGTITQILGPVFNQFSKLETITGDLTAVNAVDDLAFNNCIKLGALNINYNGLTKVGCFAFMGVKCLPANITFSNSSLVIKEGAFNSTNVVSVDMSALTNSLALNGTTDTSATSGYGAFGNCTSLTSVVLPPNITLVPISCFDGCSALREITIPASVTVMGASCLNTSGQLTVHMQGTTPPALGGYGVFYISGLQHIYVPASAVETYKAAPGWSNNYIKNKIEAEP